jgi:Na+-transporting NADH:ubiquinone oxidoreductase subunit NqrB
MLQDQHLGTHAIAQNLIFFGAIQHHNKKSFVEAVREVKRSVIFVVYAQFVAYICIFHRIADSTLCRCHRNSYFLMPLILEPGCH